MTIPTKAYTLGVICAGTFTGWLDKNMWLDIIDSAKQLSEVLLMLVFRIVWCILFPITIPTTFLLVRYYQNKTGKALIQTEAQRNNIAEWEME